MSRGETVWGPVLEITIARLSQFASKLLSRCHVTTDCGVFVGSGFSHRGAAVLTELVAGQAAELAAVDWLPKVVVLDHGA